MSDDDGKAPEPKFGGARAVIGASKRRLRSSSASRKKNVVLQGHVARVNSVTVMSDSRFVASASDDSTVRVWHRRNVACTRVLEGHDDSVWFVSSLPDGRLCSASADNTIATWTAEADEPQTVLKGHKDIVSCALGTWDAMRIVSCSHDTTLKIWDAEPSKTKCRATLTGHKEAIWGISLSTDGRSVYSGSTDGTVRTWDLDTCKETASCSPEGEDAWVFDVTVVDATTIAAACGDKSIRLLDTRSGKEVRRLVGHEMNVSRLAMSLDRRHFFSAGNDGTVRVWDIKADGKQLGKILGHDGYVRGITILDKDRIVTAGYDFTVRIWAWASAMVAV